MDNNLSGGIISNDNTLSGIIDITANNITAQTITGEDGYFSNLYVENLQIVGQDGSLGITSWGSFWSLQTQTNPITNAVNFMTFNNFDASNNNTHLKSGSTNQIQVDLSGVYNIQFSAQTNITQGSNGIIYIWLRVNGIDIASTTGKENIGNNNGQIISWNYILPLNANDYIQLVWISSDIHVQLLYEAQSVSPTKPAIPSIILTIQAASTNIKGDQGIQGIQGEKGNQGNPATVSVGTTTTGGVGDPAVVSNSGTASNAILNFIIPQGQQGIQGIQGEKGERGHKGEKGNDGDKGSQGEQGPKGEQGGLDPVSAAAILSAATTAGSLAGDIAGTASGAIAGTEAGAISGAEAGALEVAELEPRIVVLETKTQAQNAYVDVGLINHTEFDGILQVNTNAGFQRIVLNGEDGNGKIIVGASGSFQTEIQPTIIVTENLFASQIDSLDNTLPLNIGNTATEVILRNNTIINSNSLTVQQTGSSGTKLTTLGVETQTVTALYIDTPDIFSTLSIGQTASVINIGNELTSAIGVPQINLYGKVFFDPTELVGVVYQFFN